MNGLIAALLEGAFETPLWESFLRELRKVTGAEHATLLFRPPGRDGGEVQHLYSGTLAPVGPDLHDDYLASLSLLRDYGMVEGRVYRFEEIHPPTHVRHRRFYDKVVVPSGVSAARLIRVEEKSGVNAWLTISRQGDDFGAQETELLTALAPVLRGVLRNFVALERERFAAAVTGDAMRRLYFAWMTLDERGTLLDCDPEVEKVFRQIDLLSRGPGSRLNILPKSLDREIHAAIGEIATNPQTRPRAFTLNRDPWLDILLLPALQKRGAIGSGAAVIAYLHGDSWQTADRCDQLVQLFGLSRGEARLALSLSRGMSMEEAAAKFGLKIDTARKYSKIIYAKTGARGMPDLVRIVMRSVLAIAPER